ncbi:hypothetical protein C2E31_12580 [Rhodopirellula baltica]|nr:hypothetical protein C2E31_12580 [Rhodopirellula baltica]
MHLIRQVLSRMQTRRDRYELTPRVKTAKPGQMRKSKSSDFLAQSSRYISWKMIKRLSIDVPHQADEAVVGVPRKHSDDTRSKFKIP